MVINIIRNEQDRILQSSLRILARIGSISGWWGPRGAPGGAPRGGAPPFSKALLKTGGSFLPFLWYKKPIKNRGRAYYFPPPAPPRGGGGGPPRGGGGEFQRDRVAAARPVSTPSPKTQNKPTTLMVINIIRNEQDRILQASLRILARIGSFSGWGGPPGGRRRGPPRGGRPHHMTHKLNPAPQSSPTSAPQSHTPI
jgi:hypothetical protein